MLRLGGGPSCRGHVQVEAVVVPLEEHRALKALERRSAELYWDAHERRHPSRPGDDVPDGRMYDSMEERCGCRAERPDGGPRAVPGAARTLACDLAARIQDEIGALSWVSCPQRVTAMDAANLTIAG
jgi:hypothetical protein